MTQAEEKLHDKPFSRGLSAAEAKNIASYGAEGIHGNSNISEPAISLSSLADELKKLQESEAAESRPALQRTPSPIRVPTLATLVRDLQPSESTSTSESRSSKKIGHRHPTEEQTYRPLRRASVRSQATTITTEGKRSIGIQPLRRNKVTIDKDEHIAPEPGERRRSLAVQPLRGAKITFSEDETMQHEDPGSSRVSISAEDNLRNSIAGMEKLMQEAVHLAQDATDKGFPEEVPKILEDARTAMSNTAQIQAERSEVVRQRSPLRRAITEVKEPYMVPAGHGHDARPTVRRGPSYQSQVVQYEPTPSMQGSVHNIGNIRSGPRAIWDEDWPHHRVDSPQESIASMAHPHLPQGAVKTSDPTSIDWEYAPQRRPTRLARRISPSSDPDDVAVPMSAPSTTDGLARNIPARKASILDNLRQRAQSNPVLQSVLRPSIDHFNLEGTSSPPAPHEGVSPTREVAGEGDDHNTAHSVPKATNWGQDKYDEQDFVDVDDRYFDLKGRNHLSLKENENFNIQHGHRRQPIARNWGTSRKRFTAAIACMNTALIGLLVGIYVSLIVPYRYRHS